MGLFSKANLIGDVIGLLSIGIIWFFSGFYKRKVIFRWLIQLFIFLILSAGFFIGITVLAKTESIFWIKAMISIGAWFFTAFVFSIYFLITRGIIIPKRKKKAHEKFREELKKHGFEDERIDKILKYDE